MPCAEANKNCPPCRSVFHLSRKVGQRREAILTDELKCLCILYKVFLSLMNVDVAHWNRMSSHVENNIEMTKYVHAMLLNIIV